MFGISRFGINKIWLGFFGLGTIAFYTLSTLYSLDHVVYLKEKCLSFVGSESSPNFNSCFENQQFKLMVSLYALAGFVGIILLRLLFRFKDWKKLLNLSNNINSVYRKKLVFFVFFIGVIIKTVLWSFFGIWLFFQISTGYNENVATNDGFYTEEVRRTNLQWFNYVSFILGFLFFYITLRLFSLFGTKVFVITNRKELDYYHCFSMVLLKSQIMVEKTSSRDSINSHQKGRIFHILALNQWYCQ